MIKLLNILSEYKLITGDAALLFVEKAREILKNKGYDLDSRNWIISLHVSSPNFDYNTDLESIMDYPDVEEP